MNTNGSTGVYNEARREQRSSAVGDLALSRARVQLAADERAIRGVNLTGTGSAAYEREVTRRTKQLLGATEYGAGYDPEAIAGEEYRSAFGDLLRGRAGDRARQILRAGERRDQSSTTTAGGYTIPRSFYAQLTLSMKWAGAIRSVCTVLETPDGRPLDFPLSDATTYPAHIVGENTIPSSLERVTGADGTLTNTSLNFSAPDANMTQDDVGRPITGINIPAGATIATVSSATAGILSAGHAATGSSTTTVFTIGGGGESDPIFRSMTLKAWDYITPAIRYSIQLDQDAGFDIEPALAKLAALRLALGEEPDFTTGSGVSGPLGVVGATTVGETTASNAAITFAELSNLFYTLNKVYRESPDAAWMMNSTTAKMLNALEDSTGQPIFNASFGPGRLLGAKVVINDYMANVGSSTVPVLFGDWKSGYVVRTAGVTATVLKERFAPSLQNALLCYERVDGAPLDVDALVALACHV